MHATFGLGPTEEHDLHTSRYRQYSYSSQFQVINKEMENSRVFCLWLLNFQQVQLVYYVSS